jgi:hypothetical protein
MLHTHLPDHPHAVRAALGQRFARGEITKEQYEETRRALERSRASASPSTDMPRTFIAASAVPASE